MLMNLKAFKVEQISNNNVHKYLIKMKVTFFLLEIKYIQMSLKTKMKIKIK